MHGGDTVHCIAHKTLAQRRWSPCMTTTIALFVLHLSLSVSLSFSLGLSLFLSHFFLSLSLFISLYLSIYLPLVLRLSLPLYLFIYFSVLGLDFVPSLPLSFSPPSPGLSCTVCLFLLHTLFLRLLSLYLHLSPRLRASFHLFVSLALTLPLTLPPYLCLSLSLFLYPALPLSYDVVFAL